MGRLTQIPLISRLKNMILAEVGHVGYKYKPYTGNYRHIEQKIEQYFWALILYGSIVSIAFYVYPPLQNPIALFIIIEIPLIMLISYTTNPNHRLYFYLPFHWICTAMYACFVYAQETLLIDTIGIGLNTNRQILHWLIDIGLLIDLLQWVYFIYWESGVLFRGAKLRHFTNINQSNIRLIRYLSAIAHILTVICVSVTLSHLFAKLLVEYLQIVSMEQLQEGTFSGLSKMLNWYQRNGYYVLWEAVIGFLILGSLKFAQNPRPEGRSVRDMYRSMSAHNPSDSIFIRVINQLYIIGACCLFKLFSFILISLHLIHQVLKAFVEFWIHYLNLICTIFLSMVVCPTLLYLAHKIMLIMFELLLSYIHESYEFFSVSILWHFIDFLLIHAGIFAAIAIYYFAIPLMLFRYEGTRPIDKYLKDFSQNIAKISLPLFDYLPYAMLIIIGLVIANILTAFWQPTIGHFTLYYAVLAVIVFFIKRSSFYKELTGLTFLKNPQEQTPETSPENVQAANASNEVEEDIDSAQIINNGYTENVSSYPNSHNKLFLTTSEMHTGVNKLIIIKNFIKQCQRCKNSNRTQRQHCKTCNGKGHITDDTKIQLKIPARSKPGKKFKFGAFNANHTKPGPIQELYITLEEQ